MVVELLIKMCEQREALRAPQHVWDKNHFKLFELLLKKNIFPTSFKVNSLSS
jgi:hypothetical protein